MLVDVPVEVADAVEQALPVAAVELETDELEEIAPLVVTDAESEF